MRVLVVDDEPAVATLVRRVLRGEAYDVDGADSLARARALAMSRPYDALVLDHNLPDGTGTGFIRELRAAGIRTPVLMLTAMADDETTVQALDAGADDYVTKPFSVAAFTARLRAVVRRGAGAAAELVAGNVVLNRLARELRVGGAPVKLTPRELAVLELLLARVGAVVARADLERHALRGSRSKGSNVLDVAVLHVRRKLEAAHASVVIDAQRGVGFRLTASSGTVPG